MKKSKSRNTPPPTFSDPLNLSIDESNITVKFAHIPMINIDIEDQIIRSKIDDEHTIELAMSMSKHGLLEPIVVLQNGKNYQLAAGLHRLVAAHRLNWKSIPAMIRSGDSKTPIKALALTENIVRRDLTLAEECEAIAYLYEVDKLSPSQICQLIGKSRAYVDRRLAAPQLAFEVREALFEGFISMAIAETINLVDDPAIRADILNKAIFGKMNNGEVQQLKALYQETSNVHAAVEEGLETSKHIIQEEKKARTCDACGEARHLHELRPIWICRQGCDPAKLDCEPGGETGDRGDGIVKH